MKRKRKRDSSPDMARMSACADDGDSSSGADCSSSSGAEYEVFLSFRGPDTRLTFTDFLYHSLVGAGIEVFKDNEEIREGEKIGGELLDAIESSKIYMPIFSENYASSAWCLRELAHMVKCAREATDKVILPIFCGAKPDDLKLKNKSLYLDDMEKHKEKFSHDDVRQWKEALIEVARIEGWDLEGKGHGEIITTIVSKVLTKLMKRSILPDQFVGIHGRVKAFMGLSPEDSPDVHYLVIHGMGGIGKTTLASAIFNRISNQFEGCSFLSNIREFVQQRRIVELQKQMLSDLCLGKSVEIHNSVHAGTATISTRFHKKKILLVLDDVDKIDQLFNLARKKEWFGPGSKIIITTRDINFLPISITTRDINFLPNKEENKRTSFQAHSEEFKFYEMTGMDTSDALKLLSKHAFHTDFPPCNFKDISHKIIGKTGGLPLALEVIGSALHNKSIEFWKGTFKKLDSVSMPDVLHTLQISYDMLEDRQKEIFLDIACFFIGEKRLQPYYMWKASNYIPKIELLVLTRMSLIKIVKNDTFWMQNQLRDFGMEIVRHEDFKFPGKRSRLWQPKIAFKVVRMKEGTDKIVALRLTGLSIEYDFTSEEFSKMPNLRFLELEGGNLIGDFKNLLSKLTWLSWSNCPSELHATNLCLEKLVVLKLSGINITEDWAGWRTYLVSKDLKDIEITQCPNLNLRRTPDVSKCSKLKRLVLQGGKTSLVANGSLSKLVVHGFCQD